MLNGWLRSDFEEVLPGFLLEHLLARACWNGVDPDESSLSAVRTSSMSEVIEVLHVIRWTDRRRDEGWKEFTIFLISLRRHSGRVQGTFDGDGSAKFLFESSPRLSFGANDLAERQLYQIAVHD